MTSRKRKNSEVDGFLQPETFEEKKLKLSEALPHKLIIGIDLGTTFSGVSWVTTDKKDIDDINIINIWPGTTANSWKTPTTIAYHCENKGMQKNTWGFEVEHGHTSYSWTKLLLDSNSALEKFDDPELRNSSQGLMKLPTFQDAQGVCSDFMHEVMKYVFKRLRRQLGSIIFDNTLVECWVTHPATWTEKAKRATMAAAQKAGFASRPGDKVITIAEPEAAALASLHRFSDVNGIDSVKPNDHILICDCGGGTVDITTYTIIEVSPQLKFDELCIGVGGKCGATWLDRNLHKLLSERFGAAFDAVPDSKKCPGSHFMTQWEKAKRSFGLDDDVDWTLKYLKMKALDSEYYDQDERSVKLSRADMQEIFDPVVNKIIDLVSQQFHEARSKNALINRIILVGGFGDNAYLYQELTTWCGRHGNIKLVCPENAQAAVVRGAALRGLENVAPRTKLARHHYGHAMAKRFRTGVDPAESGYIDDFDNWKYCGSRVEWIFKKGDPIIQGTEKTFDLVVRASPGVATKNEIKFFSSSLDDAPEYRGEVELVGSIVTKFPADFDFGPALTSKYNLKLKKMLFRVSFKLQVIFGNQGDILTFNTLVNGRVQGTADINFGALSD